MRGKELRWKDLFNPFSSETFIIDTSKVSELPIEFKVFQDVLDNKLSYFNAIIANPGFLEKESDFLSKNRISAVVRLDWTNVHKLNGNYPLKVYKPKHILISSPEDALLLGAKAVAVSFILGFDEDMETKNIEMITKVVRDSMKLSIPVIIDVEPIGEKVMSENFERACELGLTMMTEAGADCILIPEVSIDLLRKMKNYRAVDLIVKIKDAKMGYIKDVKDLVEGFCIDLFDLKRFSRDEIEKISVSIHG